MKLNTKNFGTIEIDEKGIINFPCGIPGFADVKQYVLLGNSGDNSPFRWLQSVDRPDLAFPVMDPWVLRPDYTVDVNDGDLEVLKAADPNKMLVLSIVVVPEDISKMTANLAAPILINTECKIGKQVILENREYRTRHYIMEEMRASRGGK